MFHKHIVLIFCQFCGRYVLIGLSMYFAQGQKFGLDQGVPEGTCSQVLRSTSVDL